MKLSFDEIQDGRYDITTIDNLDALNANLVQNDIPLSLKNATHEDYVDFLAERRNLMAKKIKAYYESL